MSRLIRLLLVVTLLLTPLATLSQPRTVYALDSDGVNEVITALQSFGTVVNSLSGLAGLGEPIPFTDVDPSAALKLNRVFSDTLGALGSPPNLDTLAQTLRTRNPYPGDPDFSVRFENVESNDTNNTLSFDFTATHTMTLPLRLSEGKVNLDGGDVSEITVIFRLTAPFAFGYDRGASNPSEKVFLTNEPTIAFTAEADVPAIAAFQSLLGFAAVDVSGALALNIALRAAFADPDGNGRLTMDEWSSTALGDLVTVAYADGPGNDINSNLELNTSVVPGEPDATIAWVDANLGDGDGPGTPDIALNSLEDFTHVDAADMLGGLGQLASAIISVQNTRDLDLPFLQEGMAKAVGFAQPLLDFLKQQGEAAMICGRADGDPPTGGYWNAAYGDELWCQAILLENPTSVEWKVEGGTAFDPPDGILNTAGINPTEAVHVILGPKGLDSLRIEFKLPGETNDDLVHSVTPLFLTVQELADKLGSLAGFEAGALTPAYDPDTHSLTYRLQKALGDAELLGEKATLDFGDQLKSATGLIGLNPTAQADVSLDGDALAFDLTFGTILVADPRYDDPETGNIGDRFYLKVRPGEGEHEFSADASVEVTNVELGGRLAFLDVTATGATDAPGGSPGTAFSLGRADPGQPMIAVDIAGGTISDVGGGAGPISDAIRLSSLLGDLSGNTSLACNVGMAAGLRVAASMGDPPTELTSGKVGISWPTVFDASCAPDTSTLSIATDAEFADALKAFDIDPNNPMALLSTILNAVDSLAGGIEAVSGGGATILDSLDLPLVGMKPRELLGGLSELQNALDQLRSNPAASLQELETALENALANALEVASDPSMVTLDLGDAPGSDPNVKDLLLSLDLGYEKTSDQQMVLDLGEGMSDLVGLSSNNSFQVTYDMNVGLHLGIPLNTAFDPGAIRVLDTTGLSGSLNVEAPEVGVEASIGPLTLGLAGVAKLGATLKVGRDDGTPGNESFLLSEYAGGITAAVDGPTDAKVCGVLDDTKPPEEQIALTGDACARFELTLNGIPLASALGFRAEEIENPSLWHAYVPSDLDDEILTGDIDWSLLLTALPELLTTTESLMRSGQKVPLVGSALDGGANLVNEINEKLVRPLDGLAGELIGKTPAQIESAIQEQIHTVVSDAGILGSTDGDDTPGELEDVIVNLDCGGACGDDPTAIRDVRVTMLLRGEIVDAQIPIDLGLSGLPLSFDGTINPKVGWTLLADFGLSRDDGPYIVTDGTGHPDGPEFVLTPEVVLGENPDACLDPAPELHPDVQGEFSSVRCLEGKLGFLRINVNDGADENESTEYEGDDRTKVSVTTSLDLQATGNRLTLGVLVGGGADIDLAFNAQANVDLLIRTGLNVGQSAGLPSVVGAFHLTWEITEDSDDLSEIVFDSLYIDAGDWVSQFMQPLLGQIKKVTSPLQPVIDTIRAPIPVISDLAELVGKKPITMLYILTEFGDLDATLINRFLDLVTFVNTGWDVPENLFIPLGIVGGSWELGKFVIKPDVAQGEALTPDQADNLIGPSNAAGNLLGWVEQGSEPLGWVEQDGLPPDATPVGTGTIGRSFVASSGSCDRPAEGDSAFGVEGLSFPFMSSGSCVFTLLMGKDVTLVHWDAGTMRASAGVSYNFGPIMVGPIPITIGLSGSIAVEGRFAMGYDTSGLRKAWDQGSLVYLFDGIYIDDLGADGVDVPEIRLIGTVAASAGIDALIVAAGVEGGIRLTVDLNLNDSPNPDGKLRIEEIVNKLQNPICLFDVDGSLDAFLAVWVRIGFWIFSKTFRFEIVSVHLLDFSLGCTGERPPNLADVIDGVLVLNMGPRAEHRNIQVEETDEKFVVRQLESTGPPYRFSIAAFGAYEEEEANSVWADAGNGDDEISLEPYTSQEKDEEGNNIIIRFTAYAWINGGTGNDHIRAGDGNDTLFGGPESDPDPEHPSPDNDRINGGAGADTIHGGYGDDVLSGEADDDPEILGGSGNDALIGGGGADTMDGGEGDDELTGGPHTARFPDLGDTLKGGPGDDQVDGNQGDDWLYGDEALDCDDEGGNGGGKDMVIGGDGDDHLFGGYNSDVLVGESGNDVLCGNAGDDTLDGDDDMASTPDGNDSIDGGSGADTAYGRGGDDDIAGKSGNDLLHGEDGNDDISGGTGTDTLYGGAGRDYLFGDGGSAVRPAGQADATSVSFSESVGDPDFMYGGGGNDVMYGEGARDEMHGDAGADMMYGNDGDDLMRGGGEVDTMQGNADNDEMYGDSGNDLMFGNEHDDIMRGGLGDDYMEGNGGGDTMYGDAGQDDMIGGSDAPGQPDARDVMYGNAGQDVMAGDNASITRPGGIEIDGTVVRSVTLHDLDTGNGDTTHSGNDDMQGDAGNDDMYGGGESDTMNGNAGDDYVEGNGGADEMYGDAGQDDLVGGTSQGGGGQPDAADLIYGGSNGPTLTDDFDVIAGDNALIMRAQNGGVYITDDFAPDTQNVVRRIITLYDVATITSPVHANTSGGDILFGEDGFDIMYGQGGDEIGMLGGSGNDVMYGNEGDDVMLGNDGQDDIIGGTGRTKSDDPASSVDGRLDGTDRIYGGSGTADADTDDYDVILGDNAAVFRALDNDGAWVINTFSAAITRIVRHYDVGTVAQAAANGVSGGDVLRGEDHDDIMYGQGGNDDMQGGSGDDYMEGNANTDTMSGNPGNDDMVGGTGRINDDPATGVNGRLDANDLMYGNDGFDVMAGDNAVLVRTLVNDQWVSNTFNGGIQHEGRILLDENSPDALLVSGGDEMHGGAQDDLMYGQAGDDQMYGDEGDDLIEGNSDNDTMYGGADQDDMIGGTVDASIWDGADSMYGGSEGDVMAGDNAIIGRPLVDGLWQIDPNTLDEVRTITLLNIEVVGGPAADPLLSGSDTMYGNEGSDRMFGQGNDDVDSDGDGLFNEDPPDGVDNDMDGRESTASTQYDCADGFDNDGDGFADTDDPGCTVNVDEDGGGDVMYGNEDDDFMEGNHGADLMYGNEGEDDMWGGSSSDATGVVGSGTPPDNLADGNDIMRGGEEDDVLIGDNGVIVRATDGSGIWLRHQGPRANGDGTPFDLVVRNVGVTRSPESLGAFGNDWMQGNDGDDEGYGQQGDDYMEGNDGEDALLGDLGLITSSVQDGSNEQIIAPPGPFFEETIYPAGSFYRQFEVFSFTGVPAAAGNDIILGGDDRDSLHGADGDDILNGDGDATILDAVTGVDPNPLTVDRDKMFGGDGDDVMWGGRGDDNLWGGYGEDYLDVRPRSGLAGYSDDPPLWHTFGRFDFYQGLDLIYGGWDRDALQADVAAPGPRDTDRLIDWTGGYNVFYVCPGAYGEGTITRQGSPHLLAWMQQVIDADGAFYSATEGTSGFRDLAYVFPNERGENSHPPHPDHPGHFTCDAEASGVSTLRVAAIELSHTAKGRQVEAQVTVWDEDSVVVKGATVTVNWTVPGSAVTVSQRAKANAGGVAQFSVKDVPGVYTLTVVDVALDGYVFDADNSVLSASIDTTR